MIRLEKFIISIAEKANWVSAASVVIMMVLTAADVILRFFRMPIPGTYEIVGLLGTVTVSFSLGYTSIERGHIAVDFLVHKFNVKTRLAINAVNNFIGMVFFGIIAWRCVLYAQSLHKVGEVSLTIQMPTYPFVYGIAVGSVLLCFVLMVEFIQSLRGVETA